jgi:hypothetical protein
VSLLPKLKIGVLIRAFPRNDLPGSWKRESVPCRAAEFSGACAYASGEGCRMINGVGVARAHAR